MANKISLNVFQRASGSNDFRDLLRDLSDQPDFYKRRSGKRVPRTFVLHVQPLDGHFQPVGPSFQATTKDVSNEGLGFLHDNPFPTEYVRVSPAEASTYSTLARVCYSVLAGGMGPMYQVGCEFVDSK